MEFYKKRNFSELISDTFGFFKEYGGNYFYNYLLINGGLLILLLVIVYFGYGEFIQQLMGGNIDGESYLLEEYFVSNQGMLIVTSFISLALLVLIALIAFSFPVYYMQIVAETGQKKVELNSILDRIKTNFSKLFLFYLGTIFIMGPLTLIAAFLSMLLAFLIIGFLLLFILMPLIMNLINFSLFHILHEKKGYLSALSYAFKIQFSKKFWPYVGSTFIVYLVINVVVTIFTLIPALIIGFSSFIVVSSSDTTSGGFGFLLIVIYLISIVVGFIIANLFYVNAGLMYYDSREDLQTSQILSEIDEIGKSE